VEYGSYACPHCRAANERITEVRNQLGDRLRYVFRHRPLIGSDIARARGRTCGVCRESRAVLDAHVALMTRSNTLTEDDLRAVADTLGLTRLDAETAEATAARAKRRVDRDIDSALASGVRFTPTFFINGAATTAPGMRARSPMRCSALWGIALHSAALSFASWAPSTGVLLLLATILAIALTNSGLGREFGAFWQTGFGFAFGATGFRMSLLHWVNDALLTLFFLVVGLEIKREFTVGHLASGRAAALRWQPQSAAWRCRP